jgi:LysM repeat protein
VVRKNDSLYKIACALPIGCGGYKLIAELNGIAGPDYVIKRGQVLKLP